MGDTKWERFLPLFCTCRQEIPDKLPQFDVSSLCHPVAYARELCLALFSECSWMPWEQADGCSLEASYANFSGFLVMVVDAHSQITVKDFLNSSGHC